MMNSEVAKKLSTELLTQSWKYRIQIRHWHKRRTYTRAGKVEIKRKKTRTHTSKITQKNRKWRKSAGRLDCSIHMSACLAFAGYLQGGPGVRDHPYAQPPHVLPSNQANLIPPKCRGAAERGSGNKMI